MNWLKSVYSDTTEYFVSNPLPALGETVTISIRVFKDAPILAIILRYMKNGTDHYEKMELGKQDDLFTYYSAQLKMTQEKITYQFMIATKDDTYYYNQLEITDYPPTEDFDFQLIAGFESPEWVKKSVFYQIFPDRFCNGNPENDVKDGEYSLNGHPTIHKEWTDRPGEYEETFNLDFFGGDLEGVQQKLPYLKELGVNAIYLNPIFTAPSIHKYDCMDYYEVDPHFGGNEALASLSKAAHEVGVRIMVDMSINHTGCEHRWFNKSASFFPESVGAYHNPESEERSYYYFNENNTYNGWFGEQSLPTLNYSSMALRNILYKDGASVIKTWLKPPYSIDSWRLDVGFCMARVDQDQLHHEVWPEIRRSVKEENPKAYLLAEHWTDPIEYLRGNEWDATMNYFGFLRPVRQFLGQADEFVRRLSRFGITEKRRNAAAVAKMFIQHLARMPYQIALLQYNLLDSHDISRLHHDENISFESYRGAVVMLFTFPGTPNVYYGNEVGLNGHPRTNEGCRYPMEWREEKQDKNYFTLYQKLAHYKQNEKQLHDGGFKVIYTEGYVLSYVRFTDKKATLVVSSQETEAVEATMDVSVAGIQATSKIHELFGRSNAKVSEDGCLTVSLKPQETLVFDIVL
ncbi:MAG: alpha amylase N-terminal ig-like domain-containing protein [Clostridia bacterium]|nr:alpha amylase N-terminal ig-like domain-containing protein [Clostridia bacterium]